MPLKISNCGPPLTELEITALEIRIGRLLPTDYRNFLLTHNGGVPESHVIRNDEVGDLEVQLFYGIRHEEYFDIDLLRESMRGRWPERFLAIAIGSFGDFYCLSLSGPDSGEVHFWDHEQESEQDEPATELNLFPIAKSFAEFLYSMEPIDSDEYLREWRLRHPDA